MGFLKKIKKTDLMKAIKKAGIASEVEAADVLVIAHEVIIDVCGDDIAHEVKPLFFRNQTLMLTVTSSIIAHEIKLQETTIKIDLNRRLDNHRIDRVVTNLA